MSADWTQPILDERAKLGKRSGMHAFIVGVSRYPHLTTSIQDAGAHSYGMTTLAGPALAACKIYRWLRKHADELPAPLATCSLLISPASSEQELVEPELQQGAPTATLTNFLKAAKALREAANDGEAGHTFFYFAGHGVQRSGSDSVLLLEGFGDGIGGELFNAVDLFNLRGGMAPQGEFSNIARTQFYFLDACRSHPEQFKKFHDLTPSAPFSAVICDADNRQSPVFYSTILGAKAYTRPGGGTEFSRALLACFDSLAACVIKEDDYGHETWGVTAASLDNALGQYFAALRRRNASSDDYDCSAAGRHAVIRLMDGPPLVPVTLVLEPSDALSLVEVEVCNRKEKPVWTLSKPVHPHPYRDRLPAGSYHVRARIQPSDSRFADYTVDTRKAEPPARTWRLPIPPPDDPA